MRVKTIPYLYSMKLLKYLIIRITCNCTEAAIQVYNTLYPTTPTSTPITYEYQEVQSPSVMVPNSPLKPNDKKEELIESLEYLNSKKRKTKHDKESIYMLESILKNMK